MLPVLRKSITNSSNALCRKDPAAEAEVAQAVPQESVNESVESSAKPALNIGDHPYPVRRIELSDLPAKILR